MIKLIVFDWDDVFTKGATQGYFNCYHKILESFGVKLTPEEERKRILANWGAPVEKELGGLLKENPYFCHRKVVGELISEYSGKKVNVVHI